MGGRTDAAITAGRKGCRGSGWGQQALGKRESRRLQMGRSSSSFDDAVSVAKLAKRSILVAVLYSALWYCTVWRFENRNSIVWCRCAVRVSVECGVSED